MKMLWRRKTSPPFAMREGKVENHTAFKKNVVTKEAPKELAHPPPPPREGAGGGARLFEGSNKTT